MAQNLVHSFLPKKEVAFKDSSSESIIKKLSYFWMSSCKFHNLNDPIMQKV